LPRTVQQYHRGILQCDIHRVPQVSTFFHDAKLGFRGAYIALMWWEIGHDMAIFRK
jgi:hypothetical protein